jgi:hypothetical protein
MGVLVNFPALSQLTSITSDGKPSENSQFDCVAASIGMAMLYYQGKTAWDSEINPDMLKDAAYSEGYTGGTAASAYIPICEKLGYTLSPINDTPANLVQHIHQELQAGHPVVVTVPDVYVAASLKWSHVLCMYGELGTGLLAMDPYPLPGTSVGHTIHNSDSQWASLLEFNQIWVVTEKEVDVTITLSTPGVSQFFEAVPGGWTCLQTGKAVGGAILAEYARYGGTALCGLTFLGIPVSSELPVEQLSSSPQLAGHGIRIQFFERGVLAYDVDHILDNPPGAGAVYTVHLYGGVGSDPLIAQLEKQLVALQKQIAPLAIPSTLIADMQLIKITSAKY